MKIQDLAIIFVIIILPISLVISEYTQYQIQTVNTQTLYDTKLTSATYDAIKAFQLNAQNSSTSDLANSRIRDLEASVSTFKNSIMATFRLNGYTEEELNQYIPALVYTLYDGFYIYAPFDDITYTETDERVKGKSIYGLKPYINYSCRYKSDDIDVVITYALDNHISVQGKINGEYVNKSGYLIDGINVTYDGDIVSKVDYNGVDIVTEELKEYLPIPEADTGITPDAYSYVKIDGVKYYNVDYIQDGKGYDSIIYISNGSIYIQCKKTEQDANGLLTENQEKQNAEYEKYCTLIKNNNQAMQYYAEAQEFTDWLYNDSGLVDLKYDDACEVDGGDSIWENNETYIFQDSNNIENELSNFNQHRLAVIRHVIEKNLANAIANYNNYSGATNEFQMPELKENEWDYIIHNISLISFLQGLNIGGKVYNGYTIVTNSESEEVVLESNIYILGSDNAYHKIGEKDLEANVMSANSGIYGNSSAKSAGRLNIDFKKKSVTSNNIPYYYYTLNAYKASYKSVIMQDDVTTYEDIYAYVNEKFVVNSEDKTLAQAFYTALGRERKSKYDIISKWNIESMVATIPGVEEPVTPEPEPATYTVTYNANGGLGNASIQDVSADVVLKDGNIFVAPSGKHFSKWNTNPSGIGTSYDAGGTYTFGSNITLYAIWEDHISACYTTHSHRVDCYSNDNCENCGEPKYRHDTWGCDSFEGELSCSKTQELICGGTE